METKDAAIARIGALLERIAARFAEEDADEQAWMRGLCSPAARPVLDRLSVPALHLIEAIPPHDADVSVNIVGLARTSGIPKGTVSKMVRRLVDDGVIARHRLPDNRKEVHLRLTELGTEIRLAHRSLHEQMNSGVAEFLTRYTEAELAVVDKILDDLLRMPREGLRFRPDLLAPASAEPTALP